MKNRKLETKAVILRKSYRLFLEENLEKVTIRDIEKAIHLTRGAVFYYFKDKQHLFESVVDNFYFEPIKEFYDQEYKSCFDFNSFLKKYKSPSERVISQIQDISANINVNKAFFHFTLQASMYYPEFDVIYNEIMKEEHSILSNVLSHMVGNMSKTDLQTITHLYLCLSYGNAFYNTFSPHIQNMHPFTYLLNKLGK